MAPIRRHKRNANGPKSFGKSCRPRRKRTGRKKNSFYCMCTVWDGESTSSMASKRRLPLRQRGRKSDLASLSKPFGNILIARQENLADSIWWEFYFRAKEREGWPFLLCFHNVKIRRMKRHYFQAFFISHGFTEIGKGRPCSFLTKIDRDENNPFFQE